MRPLCLAFALLPVLLLLRLSAALSLFTLNNRVRVSSTLLPAAVLPPSMKLGSGGVGLLSWRSRSSRPSVLALIGGIASGKSTVSRALGAECGLEVIDADKLGHESYQPGTRCFGKLVDAFGANIVAGDGTIDRRALGKAVRYSNIHTAVHTCTYIGSYRYSSSCRAVSFVCFGSYFVFSCVCMSLARLMQCRAVRVYHTASPPSCWPAAGLFLVVAETHTSVLST